MSDGGSERVASSADGLTDALNRMALELRETNRQLDEAKRASEDRDEELRKRDEQLAAYGRTNRVLVRISIAGWALDILITIVLTVIGFQAYNAGSSAAAAQQQGKIMVQKICTTFGRLGDLQPPPGDPRANPSQAYLRQLHAQLVELGTDLGCEP
jgi:hypothetical protein